jgi:hypothetical protein
MQPLTPTLDHRIPISDRHGKILPFETLHESVVDFVVSSFAYFCPSDPAEGEIETNAGREIYEFAQHMATGNWSPKSPEVAPISSIDGQRKIRVFMRDENTLVFEFSDDEETVWSDSIAILHFWVFIECAVIEVLHGKGLKEDAFARMFGVGQIAETLFMLRKMREDGIGTIDQARSMMASFQANARHAPSQAEKAVVQAKYRGERDRFASKDDAAYHYTKNHPYEFATIRKWLKGV